MSRYRYNEDVAIEMDINKSLIPLVSGVFKANGKEEEAEDMQVSVKRYGADTVTLRVGMWDAAFTRKMLDAMEASAVQVPSKITNRLKAYEKILLNPQKAKIKNLELLPKLLAVYLSEGAIDGWVYMRSEDDSCHVAYVVERIYYSPPGDRSPAYVAMCLKANKAEYSENRSDDDGLDEKTVTWNHDSIMSATVDEILFRKGVLKETTELKGQYLHHLALFENFQPQANKQFLCTTTACEVTGSRWDRDKWYTLPHDTKMVNDEGILGRKVTLQCSPSFWEDYPIGDAFNKIPIHPYILMYDLTRHCNCWVHVSNCKPYVYDPTLRYKLVLPPIHRDLIDVLTSDMDVFVDDIIAGKSGGTAVLCFGQPGVGKTLTAEVYSELVERPLYRIHAGQLGIDIASVESTLEEVLRRAERWGAVMLIDEADVYIRARSNDMQHNAVVAAFLRTLEYFNGLLFMTTNRVADVDDAIASRMVAMFKYELPTEPESKAIWNVLSTQFKIDLGDKFIGELYEAFPKLSGRDIKQLLKLVQKYCKQKELLMDIEAFRICAMFRGIV